MGEPGVRFALLPEPGGAFLARWLLEKSEADPGRIQ